MANINKIPPPKELHHDFETYSEANLIKVGASRYSRDPSTEILMCAYAFDHGGVAQWIPAQNEPLPAQLEDAVLDERVTKVAWNKSFEASIWEHVQDIFVPDDQWVDPMVLALSCAFPAKLEKVAQIMTSCADEQKIDGGNLIKTFCVPRKPRRIMPADRPELWQQILGYNRRDVVAQRSIYNMLKSYDLPAHERQMWHIDQQINRNGIPIDIKMVRNARRIRDAARADMRFEITQITGIENPKDTAQLLLWLSSMGHNLENLRSRTIENYTQKMVKDDAYHVLQMYRQIMRNSLKKFDTMLETADFDGRIRNAFQFCGAGRTARWTGRGFQPLNLPRPTRELSGISWGKTPAGHRVVKASSQTLAAESINLFSFDGFKQMHENSIDALCAAVRPAIKAPDGHVFLVADLKHIEIAVLAWLTKDENLLSIIREGKDPYLYFAGELYNQSYQSLLIEKQAGNGRKRDVAKPGMLGCGFCLGPGQKYTSKKTGEVTRTGLLGYAWDMGVELTTEESAESVGTYRNTFRNVAGYWPNIYKAAKSCVNTFRPQEFLGIQFDRDTGGFMRMRVPSGSYVYYFEPEIGNIKTNYGVTKKALTYGGDWYSYDRRESAHPGTLTQHAVSRIARDLFAHWMRNTHESGLKIVMHNADELVIEEHEDKADESLNTMHECLKATPDWWDGLPLCADSFISNRFVKG